VTLPFKPETLRFVGACAQQTDETQNKIANNQIRFTFIAMMLKIYDFLPEIKPVIDEKKESDFLPYKQALDTIKTGA
jgi:hypothetical protein